MTDIAFNLQHVRHRIRTAAQRCGRDPAEITLLAVSKTRSVTMIETAASHQQFLFAENYVQEGCDKIQQLPHLQWHFIGPLQSNKSRLVAENFAWCHSIDRLRLAQRLNDQRPPHLPPLNVLIQVNISEETTKSGISVNQLEPLALAIDRLPALKLRGLMAIPAPQENEQRQCETFEKMKKMFTHLQTMIPHADTLSMGMSEDLEAAVTAGSTLVRIGSAIFGNREYPAHNT